LCNLNRNKSTGLDGISPKFLKDGAEILKTTVTHIVNLSITTSTVPDDLKCARITPLYKKKSKLDVGNYRPVSVLATVSKIVEKAVYIQVERYLSENNILYEYQSGFRQNFSTNACLVNITDYIKTEISKGYYVGMVALDVQKAFDCVNHQILCKKLEYMGIQSNWFQSYLSNRNQIVSINGTISNKQTIEDGVPQGSLLGPLLYLVYCNDMNISVQAKLVLYADDSIIIVSGKDQSIISETLAIELDACNRWLIENKLALHPGKCEAILFCSKRKGKRVKDFSVKYNDHVIEGHLNVKYLGSIIDQSLSGKDNVSSIIRKANGKLKFLYRNRRCLNERTRKILCTSLILSHMDYAAMSWYYGLTSNLKGKLQVMQNKVVRFILELGPREHIGQLELNKVGYLCVKDRVSQLGLNLAHNIFYDRCPTYLKTDFVKVSDCHDHNTRSSDFNFKVPKANSIIETTFYCNAIRQWNQLPDQLKSMQSKDAFKTALKRYLRTHAQ
jgi:hypothetical protein